MSDEKRFRMDLINSCYMGARFRHFKGGVYVFDCVGKHSETGELMAVYHSEADIGAICIRPLEMFLSPVDRVKYPEVKQMMRFEKIEVGNEDQS